MLNRILLSVVLVLTVASFEESYAKNLCNPDSSSSLEIKNASAKTQKNPPKQLLANPASTYCIEQGGRLEIQKDSETGGEYGVCYLPDGRSQEEWSFFREHADSTFGPLKSRLEK